jgi:hypothetical protein
LLVHGARLGTARRIGAIMTSIAKNPILLTHPLGGSSDILSAWNIDKVTLAEADALLEQPFHEGDRVVDSRTGEQFVFQLGTLKPVESPKPPTEDGAETPAAAR